MSGLKYTDHAVVCDADDCTATLWGSSVGLRDGMTLTYIRKQAKRRGWTSRKVPRAKMDSYSSRTEDFCPVHSREDADGQPSIP